MPCAGYDRVEELRDPLRAIAKRAVFRDRRSPSVDPASGRLMRGGLRPWSERVNVDHGQVVGRCLDDVAVIVHLHELAEVGRRSAGGRERGRFERLAEMREDFSNWPGVGDECDEADVAAAVGALDWKLLVDACEKFGPRDAGGVVGTGLVVPCTLTPARRQRETRRGGVADCERGDGGSQAVIRCEDSVVLVPVPPWRRDQVGEAVEEFVGREVDAALGVGSGRLPRASGADPGRARTKP